MNSETQPSNRWPPWLKRAVFGRRPRRTLVRAAVLVVTSLVVFRFVLLPVRVQGTSMWPTYRDKRWNFVNVLAYRWAEPRRGDVVCVQYAGRRVLLLKRIVGLPGDTVAFRQGRLFVNGRTVHEPYVKTPCDWDEPERRLAADEYYLVGDRRDMPASDHLHGITDRRRIVGKILL